MGTWPRRVTNQWCADVFLTTDFSEKKKKALICSVCQFLWYKYSHHSQFKLPT